MKKLLLVFIISTFFIFDIHSQCSGGTLAGTLTPTGSNQTISVTSYTYYNVNVTCGSTYTFSFCAAQGGSAAWDTQITVINAATNTSVAYNDDFCSLQSYVSYTATFNGTVQVLISLYNCSTSTANSGTLAYSVTPTSVTYSASCTSANATISGTTGGTFAFSPVPGDGASINAATGAISNATEGTNYNVTYTYCGGTLNIPVTMGASPCYSLNGNAQYITVAGEQCIQLTAEVNGQTGCAWSGSQINFNSDFSLSLNYYFGNNINGADGNTFTFQPSGSTACGQAGGQLGAGGIANSLAIEFDTYDNDNPAHVYDMTCDHVAVEIDGNMQNTAPYCGPVCAKAGGGNIDDGGTYEVEIAWDATAQQLSIYFDGNLRLNCSGDFVNTVFGGQNNVYWGATSATGGLNNQQYFCPSSVVVLPIELMSFETICEGEAEIIKWSTATEDRVDYFVVEYTTDGHLFYPVATIDAVGNSQDKLDYQVTSLILPETLKYYRLKSVDVDGKINTTDLIAGKKCLHPESEFLNYYSFNNEILSIGTSVENLHLSLITTDGKEVLNSILEDGNAFEISNLQLNQGVYFLNLTDGKTGMMQAFKVYHSKN